MLSPLIDIVIPAYNGEQVLRRAIESALAQTIPARVVVVDDGSRDASSDIARSFGDAVHVIRQENRGVSGARNTGVRAGSAPYIALLDQDDQWLPGKLERQLRLIEAHPSVSIVFTDMLIYREDGSTVEDGFLATTKAYVDVSRETVGGNAFLLSDQLGQAVGRFNFISPSTTLLRRATLEAIGGFDESFRLIDDADCWLRMLAKARGAVIEDRLVRSLMWDGCASRRWDELIQERLALGAKIDRDPALFPAGLGEYFKRYRAMAFYQLGVGNLRANNVGKARSFLWSSMLEKPSFGTASALAASVLPRSLRDRAGALKRVAGLDFRPRIE